MSLRSLRSRISTSILIDLCVAVFLSCTFSLYLFLFSVFHSLSVSGPFTLPKADCCIFLLPTIIPILSLSCLLLLSTYHSLPRLASLLRRGFRANRIASSLGPSVTHGASVTVPESANEGYSATVNAISRVIPDAYSRDLKLGTRSVFSTVSFQLPTLDDTSHHESTTKRWRYFRHLHSCWGRLS